MNNTRPTTINAGMTAQVHSGNAEIILPEVQKQYDRLTASFGALRDTIAMLDEKLGYVSLSPCPSGIADVSPEPERCTLAHNLCCAVSEIDGMAWKITDMRDRLQI